MVAVSLRFSCVAAFFVATNATTRPMQTTAKMTTPIRFFITRFSMAGHGAFGKRASLAFSRLHLALRRQLSFLDCEREAAPRSARDDSAECDPVPAGVAAALHFRAALSPDAGRCAPLQ